MSEPVAELLEAPPAPQKDADEIIAQLAGKEVDRLLASADIEREDQLAPVVRVDGGRAISSPAGSLAADAAKNPGDDEAVLAQQIEALIAGDMDKISETIAEPAAKPVAEPLATPSIESPAATVADAAITTQPIASTEPGAPSELESAGIESAQVGAAPDAAPKSAESARASEPQSESINVDPLEIQDDSDRRLPIYLLPLDWFNRPFAFLSNAARDALGKIAVLTSLNAAAMFVYVIWFRHH